MDQSRRQILKLIAVAPVALSVGFAGEALMRFVKPTMKPFGMFDPADLPVSAIREAFDKSDFPEPWTCIPFVFQMKIAVFNPEQAEVREIPAYIIRLQDEDIVAYSRVCPKGCRYLNYIPEPRKCSHCNTQRGRDLCCCGFAVDNPVLKCPKCWSIFDLARKGQILCGRAPRPPVEFKLDLDGESIVIASLQERIW